MGRSRGSGRDLGLFGSLPASLSGIRVGQQCLGASGPPGAARTAPVAPLVSPVPVYVVGQSGTPVEGRRHVPVAVPRSAPLLRTPVVVAPGPDPV